MDDIQQTKWQIWFRIDKDIKRMERGWRIFDFAILKFVEFPQQGEVIQRKHYKGIKILFAFWLPIESY